MITRKYISAAAAYERKRNLKLRHYAVWNFFDFIADNIFPITYINFRLHTSDVPQTVRGGDATAMHRPI
jgi:hypothetical protein